jgi:hypothetical protein
MTMSAFLTLMIGGWITTFVMIAICALNESGTLLQFGKRLSDWLGLAAPEGSVSLESAE